MCTDSLPARFTRRAGPRLWVAPRVDIEVSYKRNNFAATRIPNPRLPAHSPHCIDYAIFFVTLWPYVCYNFHIHEVSRPHTTHRIRQNSSGRVTGPAHRPLPGNTQLSQDTDLYNLGGLEPTISARKLAAGSIIKERDHWGWHRPC